MSIFGNVVTYTDIIETKDKMESRFKKYLPSCDVYIEIQPNEISINNAYFELKVTGYLPVEFKKDSEFLRKEYFYAADIEKVAIREVFDNGDVMSLVGHDGRMHDFVDVMARRIAMKFGEFAYLAKDKQRNG